jgi:uncharacterized repeat protein (TIGR01451 family)
VTVNVTVQAADPFPDDDLTAQGGVPNTAVVTAPGTNCPPGAAAPDLACSSTLVVPLQPQVTIQKTSSATLIVPGGQVPFTFVITNTTPVTALAVTVTDVLPAGLTFVSSDNAACSSADGVTLTCTLGALAAGGSVTIDVVTEAADPFPPDDVTAGAVANTASVTSPDSNCPPGAAAPAAECSSTAAVPLQPQLAITKTSTATQIVPGGTVPYVLTVTNGTAAVAPGVTISDTLPAGLTFVSSDNPGCSSADGATVTCALGDVAPGQVVVSIVTQAASPFPPDAVSGTGTVANTASVTSPGTNCPPDAAEPATRCGSTVVLPLQPQLSITKTSTATQIVPGGTVPYAFTVTNSTPAAATGVTITDTLPAGLTFLASPDGCTSADGVTVTCALGTLAAGGSVTVNVVTEAADPFPATAVDATGAVPNTARVTSPATNCPDLTSVGCDSTETVPVQPQLSVVKSSTAAQIVPGTPVPFSFTVTNPGPVVAPGVVITDVLPPGLTFVSSPDGCTSADGVTVTCALGDVAPGSVTVSIVTQAASPFPPTPWTRPAPSPTPPR